MRIFITILLLGVLHIQLRAQDEKIELEQLKAPAAPAATIISIQPNEVNRPKSAKDLEAAILTNYFGQGNITVPNSFMLELMPYWMGSRINTIPTEYLSEKVGDVFWQSLAVSVASTQKYPVYDSVETNAMGFGFRSLLRRGSFFESYGNMIRILTLNLDLQTYFSQFILISESVDPAPGISVKDYFNQVVAAVEVQSDWYLQLSKDATKQKDLQELKAALNKIGDEFSGTVESKEQVNALIQQHLRSTLLDSQNQLKALYNSFLSERTGLQLEVAGALALNFPTNNFEFSIIPKWGLWLTGTFNPTKSDKKSKFLQRTSLATMIRYMRNDVDYYQKYIPSATSYFQDNFDLGMKGIYRAQKFSLSIEVLSRYRSSLLQKTEDPGSPVSKSSKGDWDWKYLLNLTYAISPDISISYGFGKQLDPTFSVNGNIISMASLNFGFGGPEVGKN
jgi:hypothetical protein